MPLNYTEDIYYFKIYFICVLKIDGREGRELGALESLLTIQKTLTLSISNRMSLFRSFYDNKWPSQNFYQMHFGKTLGVGASDHFEF